MQNKNLWIAVIAVAIIAIGGYFYPKAVAFVGGITNYDTVSASGIQIGSGCNNGFGVCTGTLVSRVNTGFCNIQANSNTVTASTSKAVDCVNVAGTAPGTALSGITAGDKCFLQEATTTSPNSTSGLILLGASASSTSGFITANVFAYGTNFTWTALASSSWPYYCVN